ncbi:MAG: ABC transporter permease [Clostridia bacterium]|nr:ABC transporter permease [Clostridia bacterium]
MNFLTSLALFLQIAVQGGTPLLFGTLGAIMNERVGHLNLGVEGMMMFGACMGYWAALKTDNAAIAILVAGLAGMLCALIYAVLTVTFRTNHTVTGLVTTIFGTGLANFIGKPLSTQALPRSFTEQLAAVKVPVLSEIPVIGKMFFEQSIYVHIGILCAILLYIYMKKTTIGLKMRMIGENPAAADASGINITLYKYVHILLGGFLSGLGGAYLTLVYVPVWKESVTGGQGWIAVALVIFSTWSPIKAIFGAYFFGMLRGLGFKLQNVAIPLIGTVPSQFLDMVPYVVTILALVFMTLRKKKENQGPAALGLPYFREDR